MFGCDPVTVITYVSEALRQFCLVSGPTSWNCSQLIALELSNIGSVVGKDIDVTLHVADGEMRHDVCVAAPLSFEDLMATL